MRRTIGRKPGYRRKSPRKRLFGQMMRKRIFSIRPELFFQDDQEEASRKQPERSNGRKADADSRKELETGRLEQTAPEEEAKKEAPMEPAADAGDGWEESEAQRRKRMRLRQILKPQAGSGPRGPRPKGRRPKLQDRKLADRSNRMNRLRR